MKLFTFTVLASLCSLNLARPVDDADNVFSDTAHEEFAATQEKDDDDEIVHLLLHYKNQKGLARANKANMHVALDAEIPEGHIAAITTTASKKLELEDDPDIDSVEIDYKMQAMVYRRRRVEHVRKLQEQVPPGITMVEADQVPDLPDPPAGQEIKVCVVDTGYGLGHPDLPDSNDGVSGYKPDSIGGAWDIDGDGHGTHVAGTVGAIFDSASERHLTIMGMDQCLPS